MARKNIGSVYPDKSRPGSLRVAITNNYKKAFKRFSSVEAAWQWIVNINKGVYVQPNEITLCVWLSDWMETYVEPDVRPRTYERYIVTVAHLEPLYRTKLQELKPHTIKRFFTSSTLSDNSLNKVHKLLKTCLKQAVFNNYISSNPMNSLKATKVEKPEIQIMDIEDINKILEFCRQHKRCSKYYPIFYTLAHTCARFGKILALETSSINLIKNEITVKQSVEY